MAGDAYFRIRAVYKKENFETGKKEPQEVVDAVQLAILDCYEKRTGYREDVFNTSLGSMKWHGMPDDVAEVSIGFIGLVIIIEKQLNDTSFFDDDGDTFTRFAFCNGAWCESKAKVVYGKYSDFKNV